MLPATQALHLPAGLDSVQAAALPETFFTVWANVFGIGQARPGDRLLVHGGTSGIGSTALMLAKEFCIRSLATVGGEDKARAALGFGAERAVDYRAEDFVAAVAARTDGEGVRLVLDIIRGAYLPRNITALAKGGRLLSIGFLGGPVSEGLDLMQVALKRAVITGSTLRSRTVAEKAALAAELEEKVWPALEQGRCLPPDPRRPSPDRGRRRRPQTHGVSTHIGKIVLQVAS